ncbi:MAG: hypothetical protein ACJART_002688, partial [Maribacter sp.]
TFLQPIEFANVDMLTPITFNAPLTALDIGLP